MGKNRWEVFHVIVSTMLASTLDVSRRPQIVIVDQEKERPQNLRQHSHKDHEGQEDIGEELLGSNLMKWSHSPSQPTL